MQDVIKPVLRASVDTLVQDLEIMPIDRWNESVFRHYFCHEMALQNPDVDQFVESGRIDLVLHRPPQRAFIEFKFYIHRARINAYDSSQRGFKGGPGPANLAEFRECIDRLHERDSAPSLDKFVVLFYADPEVRSPHGARSFSSYLDEYDHPTEDVRLHLADSYGPISSSGNRICTQLFEVG